MNVICSVLILTHFRTASTTNPLNYAKVDDSDLMFYLYTRKTLFEPIQLTQHNLEKVDTNKPTKFIVHGFFENSRNLWYRNMTVAYLNKDDYNIIQVDWSKPASNSYSVSVVHTRPVGAIIGKLITNLYKKYGLSLDNVHIIGHSLGAHVSGYAGKEVIAKTRSAIARITGLDSAGPLFEGQLALLSGLNKHDAKVVDTIHTDGGVFGRADAIGTIDFFPNGGIYPQPGCSPESPQFPPRNYLEMSRSVFCSHAKSHDYFIRSITNEQFIGVKCDSWKDFKQNKCRGHVTAIMGDSYSYVPEATGKFYLRI